MENESEMLNIVVQNPGDSSSGSTDEWLNSIMNDGCNSVINRRARPKIQKVPEMLREIKSNEKCYDPLVVSIGPYHHGSPGLQLVEKHKIPMTRQYVMECGKGIDVVYSKVVEVAGNARKCYAERSTQDFDDEAFARMMFLDGCFILQFMYCFAKNELGDMGMKTHTIAFVHRDMFLLENELPFLVLKALMSLRFEKDQEKDVINCFIESTWPFKGGDEPVHEGYKPKPPKDEDEPAHLLELVRTKLIGVSNTERLRWQSSTGWYTHRSAKKLGVAGVHFKPGKIHLLTDVMFKGTIFGGQLTLPQITVDDATKAMLLNLVAYETCLDAPDDFGVTSYICLMDSLIDDAEDVMVLRSEGILLNYLSNDQEAADLFNEMAKDLVPSPYAYCDVKGRIERHYRSKLKIWMAMWRHTSRPWTILAFINAAIFSLTLSVLQTYFAANPPKH